MEPSGPETIEVVDSTTEQVIGRIPEGTSEDVDRAVEAARRGFEEWREVPVSSRVEACTAISAALAERGDEIAALVSAEVGMPLKLARTIQAGLPAMDFGSMAQVVDEVAWEEQIGNSLVVREPIGVVGCITPWNYPLHQLCAKVAPALTAGCSVIAKPSEVTPLTSFILAEIIDSLGLPAGVFNLVTGLGPVVGEAIVGHEGVDMVSFTGSTRAGRRVSEVASQTVKRVALELGGKSANVILDDADLKAAVGHGVGELLPELRADLQRPHAGCWYPARSSRRWRRSPPPLPRRRSPAIPSRREPGWDRWSPTLSVSACATTSGRAPMRVRSS